MKVWFLLFFSTQLLASGIQEIPLLLSKKKVNVDLQKWESVPVKYLTDTANPVKVSLRNKKNRQNIRIISEAILTHKSKKVSKETKDLKDPCHPKRKQLKKEHYKIESFSVDQWNCAFSYIKDNKKNYFAGRLLQSKIGNKERGIIQFFEETNSNIESGSIREWLKNVN
jgi:hypothetical protein